MRAVIALVVIFALVGCDDGGADDEPVETTTSMATTTTSQVTTTQDTTTTTTGPVEEPDEGTESIGVTDKVTITITDPEDG